MINKSSDKEDKIKNIILPKIKKYSEVIKTNTVSFLHYGHLGDIINSLPAIKEISKNNICNLYIQKNKLIPEHAITNNHPSGSVFLSENSVNKILPLLKKQKVFEFSRSLWKPKNRYWS